MTESNPNRCPACGNAIHPGDRFCAACGQQLGEPGFVPPAAPTAPPAATGADPGAAGPWPTPPAEAADAAWLPPGRAAAVVAPAAGGADPAEPVAARPAGLQTPTPAEAPRGEGVVAAATPDPTDAGNGWGSVTVTPAGGAPVHPPSPAGPVQPPSRAVGVAAPAPRPSAADAEDANWFVATRPSTLVAWGLIAVVGGLLLGAIGQVDPTDTLVIIAFLLVPLGLLLLPLALVCWVVQKATGRR